MIPLPGISSGGGAIAPDLSTSAESGDVYSTSNSKQGGLTINNGLPPWALGVGIVGSMVLTGIFLWKK